MLRLEYDWRFVNKQAENLPALRHLARSFATELKASERRGDLAGWPGVLSGEADLGVDLEDYASDELST